MKNKKSTNIIVKIVITVTLFYTLACEKQESEIYQESNIKQNSYYEIRKDLLWGKVMINLQRKGYNFEVMANYGDYLFDKQDSIDFQYNPNQISILANEYYENSWVDEFGYVHNDGPYIYHTARVNNIILYHEGHTYFIQYFLDYPEKDSARTAISDDLLTKRTEFNYIFIEDAYMLSVEKISELVEDHINETIVNSDCYENK